MVYSFSVYRGKEKLYSLFSYSLTLSLGCFGDTSVHFVHSGSRISLCLSQCLHRTRIPISTFCNSLGRRFSVFGRYCSLQLWIVRADNTSVWGELFLRECCCLGTGRLFVRSSCEYDSRSEKTVNQVDILEGGN